MSKPNIYALMSEPWLIVEDHRDALASQLANMVLGKSDQENEELEMAYAVAMASDSNIVQRYDLNSNDIPDGSVAVIPIRGTIAKYGFWSFGTLEMMDFIKTADANSKIKSILLVVDSPGGQVTNTDRFGDLIASIKTPVIAFVEGMACSAAYWMIAASSKIIASSNLDRIGSIGTMFYGWDFTPYYESLGIKKHEFYATKSTRKNAVGNEVLSGKYDKYRTQILDRINDQFHAFVSDHRAIDASVLSGEVYFAPDAIDNGLIDSVGTFEYALEEAFSVEVMIEQDDVTNSEQTNNPNNMKIKVMAAWAALLAFFGFESEQETEITSETMERINGELQSRSDQIAQLTAERDQAINNLNAIKTERDQANASLVSITAERDQALADLADARKNPGAEAAEIITNGKETGPKDEKGKCVVKEGVSFMENINAVSEEYDIK